MTNRNTKNASIIGLTYSSNQQHDKYKIHAADAAKHENDVLRLKVAVIVCRKHQAD